MAMKHIAHSDFKIENYKRKNALSFSSSIFFETPPQTFVFFNQ